MPLNAWAPNGAGACFGAAGPTPTADTIDIAGLVLAEFRRLPIPLPAPAIQPPGGATLVNLDTILRDTGPQTGEWNLTIVSRNVVVRAHPTSWRWSVPGGPSLTTTTPGRPWPATDVTLRLTQPGTTTLTVTTTWSGEYSVDNAPFQPVPGTVSRTTDIPLRVLSARPELVQSNALNP